MKKVKHIIAIMALALSLAIPLSLQTGCTTDDIVGSPVANTIVKSSLRLATFLVVSKNPELAPVIQEVSSYLASGVDTILRPDAMRGLVARKADAILQNNGVSASEAALVQTLLADAMDVYGQVYAVYQDVPDPVVSAEMQRLLQTLGTAINQGVLLVSSTTEASPPPLQQSFQAVTVVIE